MRKNEPASQATTTSLEKALRLLEELGRQGPSGIKALAQAVNLPAPTAHRLLGVLARAGYVRQDESRREYRLAVRLVELGSQARLQLDLAEVARPYLRRLAELSGETANLALFDGDEAVYVEQETASRTMLRLFTRVGARAPLYCTGVGKAYLAALPDPDVTAYLRRARLIPLTGRTRATPRAVLEELDRVRAQGFAVDDEEVETGVRCVAALLRGLNAAPAGALSVSGPSARLTPGRLPGLGARLLRVAAELSVELGCLQTTAFANLRPEPNPDHETFDGGPFA